MVVVCNNRDRGRGGGSVEGIDAVRRWWPAD